MTPSSTLIGRLPAVFFVFVCALQLALAEPEPEPGPESEPEPTPQGNVYQFSGAVYILGGNGGWCPADAPQTCGGIPWCCASGCSCQQLDNGVVGCCPYGGTCQGPVPAVVSTVTVYQSYPVTTTVQGAPTTVVVAGQPAPVTTTTTTPNGVVVAGATTTTTPVVIDGDYCSTMYANGPNLPTTAAGACGTILVVNEAIAPCPDTWRLLRLFSMVWAAAALLSAPGS